MSPCGERSVAPHPAPTIPHAPSKERASSVPHEGERSERPGLGAHHAASLRAPRRLRPPGRSTPSWTRASCATSDSAHDRGFPVVIPLAYGRDGDIVYLHGSAASRLFRGARTAHGRDLHDGDLRRRAGRRPLDLQHRHQLPLGRDHRPATEVKDLDEKRRGLDLMVDHIIPGRSRDARPPTEKELRSTMLLAPPPRRVLGQGPHRLAPRRGRGLRPARSGPASSPSPPWSSRPGRSRPAGRRRHAALRRALPAPRRPRRSEALRRRPTARAPTPVTPAERRASRHVRRRRTPAP